MPLPLEKPREDWSDCIYQHDLGVGKRRDPKLALVANGRSVARLQRYVVEGDPPAGSNQIRLAPRRMS